MTLLNARIAKLFRLARSGQSLELTADLFNVLNFFDRQWGVRRFVPNNGYGEADLLELVGYDQPKGRGIYAVLPVERDVIYTEGTRWRLQLGARYVF